MLKAERDALSMQHHRNREHEQVHSAVTVASYQTAMNAALSAVMRAPSMNQQAAACRVYGCACNGWINRMRDDELDTAQG
jgi:hypothetical protein